MFPAWLSRSRSGPCPSGLSATSAVGRTAGTRMTSAVASSCLIRSTPGNTPSRLRSVSTSRRRRERGTGFSVSNTGRPVAVSSTRIRHSSCASSSASSGPPRRFADTAPRRLSYSLTVRTSRRCSSSELALATARETASNGTSCGIASTGKRSSSALARNGLLRGGASMSSPIASPLRLADSSSSRNDTCSSPSAGTLRPFDIRRSSGASHSVAFGRSEAWAQETGRSPPAAPACRRSLR